MDATYQHLQPDECRLTYHFVWGAMRCRPVLIGAAAARLAELLHEKAAELGVEIQALDIDCDRVYVAVLAPPRLSPHSIVCGLKAHSSGPLRREFKELRTIPTLWTRHYLVRGGDQACCTYLSAAYNAATRRPRRQGQAAKEPQE